MNFSGPLPAVFIPPLTLSSGEYYVRIQHNNVNENDAVIPLNYFLSQNYPNPFNPTTVIDYQLPIVGYVTLKVYDILGREITLVNEEKIPGNYEVKFDGSNLSSGVYFYRLQAGDPSLRSGQGFTETKKLILMK